MTNQPTNDNTKESKALPFTTKEGFTAIPNAILTIYTMHPSFTPFDLMVYAYLLKNHNVEYGYAYPSILGIAKTLDVSKRTVERAIKKLEDLKLINKKFNKFYGNNNYYFIAPIENLKKFEETFPEVIEHRQKLAEKWECQEGKSKADRKKYEKTRKRS